MPGLCRSLAYTTSAAIFGTMPAVFAGLARVARIGADTSRQRGPRGDADEKHPDESFGPGHVCQTGHTDLREFRGIVVTQLRLCKRNLTRAAVAALRAF
jgi:hypothetical protein